MDHLIVKDAEDRMKKSVESFRHELVKIRTGKASTAILDSLRVEYFGAQVPLSQVASLSTPEARLIVIQPWDRSIIGKIEKEILKSDLGLTPINDGVFIRLAIPMLTEERRKELVKMVRKQAEEARVAVRNVRRDANEHIKQTEKSGSISEDEQKKLQVKIQELTDQYVKNIDQLLNKKEEEIMTV